MLQHDPMAFYEPPGIELLDRRERDAMDTWKSYQGASIDQRFEIGRDALARAAMDQAVAAAQRNGWFLEELDQTDASFCKHAMTLRITWYDFEEPNQLRVAVGGSAGFTDCGI